jgi:CRISPR/Cas system Type II protein with McrA/HNH and RuvC-like nuclease domain
MSAQGRKLKRMSRIDGMFYQVDREKIWKSQNHKCKYCGEKIARNKATMDHVIPISKTRYHSVVNCVVACFECNQKKDSNVNWKHIPNDNVPLEIWEQMIADFSTVLDERLKRFEYDLIATNTRSSKGGYNKWKRYWNKQDKWDTK